MNQRNTLDIAWGTIFKIATVCFSLYVVYLIQDIIVWFIFALTISILFNPLISWVHKRKIPRPVAVIMVYLVIFGLLGFIIGSTGSLFAGEIKDFTSNFSQYLEKVSPFFDGLLGDQESLITTFSKTIESAKGSIFNALFIIFGGIFITFFVITLAILLSFEERAVERVLVLFFPKEQEAFVLNLLTRVQKKVSAWFGSRVIACIFVGVVSYISLILLDAPYALSFGILAGILNFIPFIGPLITGVIVFLVLAVTNFPKAVFAIIIFTLIQQVENNILSPVLAKKMMDISPSLSLIALTIGASLWGILGAILVIPLAGILFEFLGDYLKKRKEEKGVMV